MAAAGAAETAAFTADPVALFFASAVLIVVYAAIALELVHRTTATLVGVGVLLFTHFVGSKIWPALQIWAGTGSVAFENIITHIDWNVIFLLFGMMIIVSVMARTGVFQVLALKAYKVAGGDFWRLVVLLMFLTGFLSAMLDNVTTILLLTPVTIELALVLDVDPVPILMSEVFASNIGGAATLVGDPPNLLVGSAAGLTFNQFVVNLGPIAVVCLLVLVVYARFVYRDEFTQEVADSEDVLEELGEEYRIKHRNLYRASMAIIGLVVLLFLLHSVLHMEVSVAALIGAALILPAGTVFSDAEIDAVEIFEEVEWPTLIFFMMLFMLVGAVDSVGALDIVANQIEKIAGNSVAIAVVLTIWVSAFMSALVDNIPFTATMIPVVESLIAGFPGEATVLWWALVLGADFGGNATLVGASANVVAAGMAERSGYDLSFNRFIREGMPLMIITNIFATAYVLLVLM